MSIQRVKAKFIKVTFVDNSGGYASCSGLQVNEYVNNTDDATYFIEGNESSMDLVADRIREKDGYKIRYLMYVNADITDRIMAERESAIQQLLKYDSVLGIDTVIRTVG